MYNTYIWSIQNYKIQVLYQIFFFFCLRRLLLIKEIYIFFFSSEVGFQSHNIRRQNSTRSSGHEQNKVQMRKVCILKTSCLIMILKGAGKLCMLLMTFQEELWFDADFVFMVIYESKKKKSEHCALNEKKSIYWWGEGGVEILLPKLIWEDEDWRLSFLLKKGEQATKTTFFFLLAEKLGRGDKGRQQFWDIQRWNFFLGKERSWNDRMS